MSGVGPRAIAAAVLVALSGAAGAARAENPALVGTVGTNDDFQLSLVDGSGASVQHLAAGTYTLVVHDRSTFHNFHLFGPGNLDVATTVDTTGDETFSVTLADGIYTFQCDPHAASGMRGRFAVGSAALPAPAAKLNGSIVGSKAALGGTLLLKAGAAVVTIHDRSKTDGFLLRGPGVAKKTGLAFTGTVGWAVTLKPGRYVYGSAKSAKGRRSFTVSAP
jgi:plastocyanin